MIPAQASCPDVFNRVPNGVWFSINAKAKTNEVDILLFDEIGGWGITAKEFKTELDEKTKDASKINLHIHSPGGSVNDGMGMFNLLKHHQLPVDVYISGLAASMASVIATVGQKVYIPSAAFIMVHKPWGVTAGNADDMREYADFLDKNEDLLIKPYMDKTGLPEEEIRDLLTAETWMNGEEAVEKGFADELMDDIETNAKLNIDLTQDFLNMPQAAKKYFQPKADLNKPVVNTPTPMVTPDPVPVPIEEPEPTPAPVAATIADFKAAEKKRRESITNIFSKFKDDHTDLLNECLADVEMSPIQAQSKLLDQLGDATKPSAIVPPGTHIHVGNGAFYRDGMANALAGRVGLEQIETDNNYDRTLNLFDMAKASLTERGISIYGYNRLQIVQNAFTHDSGDFGYILENIAKKSMLKGVQEANETFQEWTSKGTLTDFKINTLIDTSSFPVLDEMVPGAEYKYATLSDTGETEKLATYGKAISFNRVMIINDDIGLISSIPQKAGRAAIRTVGNLVYSVLLDNKKLNNDKKPLFHSSRKNIMTAANIDKDSLEKAELSMALQQGSNGEALNMEPAFLICSRKDRKTADSWMNSEKDPTASNSITNNPVAGMARVISDARIDHYEKDKGDKPWFIGAGLQHDGIRVSYLDGQEMPFMDQIEGWNVDGTSFKVRIDATAKCIDPRTWIKNPGVAPAP